MITLPISKFELVSYEHYNDTITPVYYADRFAANADDGTVDLKEMTGRAAYDYKLSEGVGFISASLQGEVSTLMKILCAEGNTVLSVTDVMIINRPGPVTFDIPAGCTDIWVSYVSAPAEPMPLELTTSDALDVSLWVANWADLEVSMERDGTSGTMTEVSFPVELVLDARDFVREQFCKYGLYADVWINIYKRGDHDNNYTLIKSMKLDFESYTERDDRVEIEGVKDELSEYVNSKGKNKYDILVSDLSPSKWKYNRIELLNMGAYTIAEGQNISDKNPRPSIYCPIRVNLDNAEMVPGSQEHDMKSQPAGTHATDDLTQYFFKAAGPVSLWLRIKGVFYIEYIYSGTGIDFYKVATFCLYQDQNRIGQWPLSTPKGNWQESDGTHYRYEVSVDYYEKITLYANHVLRLGFGFNMSVSSIPEVRFLAGCVSFDAMSVEFMAEGENAAPPVDIDVIKPETLLQTYLDKIADYPGQFTGKIEWDGQINPMICAAESIRGFADAYLHGSLNDFIEWMKVLGYEHQIIGKELTFAPRDTFFKGDTTALTLAENEVADLVVEADSTHAYTNISIGYEKQDYDKVNGRFEPNGTFEYTTGYTAKDENRLELVSPYRADSIGIELLLQERDKTTTDDKSDNDIFVVDMVFDESNGYYTEYKGIVMWANANIVDPAEVPSSPRFHVDSFNARFNPYYLVKYNESLIGVITDRITYTSTDMCKDAELMVAEGDDYVQGNNMRENQPITKHLFSPIEYNFATGNWYDLPPQDVRDGLVYFTYKGTQLKGYIIEVMKNYTQETETTWRLHAVIEEGE